MARIRTMEQFAKAIGLSRPTVSKYFQDAGSVRVKVREKIEAGLAETGFRPNLFAINLNRRRSKIIGLIFPSSLDPFFMGLRRQIELVASAAGYLPFVFSSDGKAELEAEAIESLTALNVAGIIMAPVGLQNAHHDKIKALAGNIPIVFIDAPFDEEEAFVGTNNAQSMTLITDYLTRFGDRPAYFDMPWVTTNGYERRVAYATTMERRGLEPLFIDVDKAETWEFESHAFEQANRNLARGGFPSKIILCANDRIAFGVMAALNQAGLKIGIGPDCDFRVAGHDNQPFSEYIWPPLTTVSQNTTEMGRLAINLLLSKLDSSRVFEDPRMKGHHILLNAELVLRASA
ncbi:LacI family DNA-binding transcriptional regulator [Devosia lacusdianchii]|uniref:LacI family DNA-binding transcriptional regulator n=1 Tax=Devosia lacusdianchii TaxID=2917991 RepID=UPI0030B8579C